MKEMLTNAAFVLLFCVIFILGIIAFTPYPSAYFVRNLFADGGPAKEPNNYQMVLKDIEIEKNLVYNSTKKSNRYDLILPKETSETNKLPVVIWVHGGAFVGGQKEDTSIYVNMIAAQGYAVANLDYSLAPESRYPSPVQQLTEFYSYLTTIADEKNLDLNRITFAGDSAGAHIVSQFLAIQTNPAYQKEMQIAAVVPEESIRGALLYCGPYSVKSLSAGQTNGLLKFIFDRIAWSYLGEKNWTDSKGAAQAEMGNQVTKNFPPTFITDANTASFEEQGREFAAILKEKDVSVETVFYPLADGKITHEYQFDLTLPQAQETFEKTIAFLKQVN